jgi:hypothetical protein
MSQKQFQRVKVIEIASARYSGSNRLGTLTSLSSHSFVIPTNGRNLPFSVNS